MLMRNLFLLLMLFSTTLFVGCEQFTNDDDDNDASSAQFKIELEKIYSPYSDGVVKVIFKAADDTYPSFSSVDSGVEWLSFGSIYELDDDELNHPSYYEGDDYEYYAAELYFKENNSTTTRSTKIRIGDGDNGKEIEVIQGNVLVPAGTVVNSSNPDYNELAKSNMWIINGGSEEEISEILSNISNGNQYIQLVLSPSYNNFSGNEMLTYIYSTSMYVLNAHNFNGCTNLRELYLPYISEIYGDLYFYNTPNLKKLSIALQTRDDLVADVVDPSAMPDNYVLEMYKQIDLVIGTESGATINGTMVNVPLKDTNSGREFYSYGHFNSVNGDGSAKMKSPFYINTLPDSLSMIEGDKIVILDDVINEEGAEKLKRLFSSDFTGWGEEEKPVVLYDIELTNLIELYGEEAFSNIDNIRTVSAPKLERCDGSAFSYCYNLTSAHLPVIWSLDEGFFSGCEKLSKVYAPAVSNMGDNVFYGCNTLDTLVLASSAESFICSKYSFSGFDYSRVNVKTSNSNGTKISGLVWVVPARESGSYNTTDIEVGPFMSLNENHVDNLVSGPLNLGSMPIDGSMISGDVWEIKDTEVITGASTPSGNPGDMYRLIQALNSAGRDITVIFTRMTKIPDRAFYYKVTPPDDFAYHVGTDNLVDVQAPEATEVGENAFSRCYDLKSVWLPNVETIGERAFSEARITSVNFEKVTTIGEYAFSSCKAINYINLPLITELVDGVFYDCTGLESINDDSFPKLTKIGKNVFSYSTNIKSVTLSGITTIPTSAFKECWDLESVNFPNVTSIDGADSRTWGAFYNCKALKYVTMPALEVVGKGAFENCTALEEISLPSATDIKSIGFIDCTSLEKVSLPKVDYVGESGFQGCNSLVEIHLPSLKSLNSYVFSMCDALKRAKFPKATSINDYAFKNCVYLNELEVGTEANFYSIDQHSFSDVDTERITLYTKASEWAYIYGNSWKLTITGGAPEPTFKQINIAGGIIMEN